MHPFPYLIKLRVISRIIISIPINATRKKYSAIVSSFFSLAAFEVRMEIKEKILEKVSKIAIIEVDSSMRLFSILSAICNEVMTNRQKPKRVADVFKIC
jgi:ATP-dependent protease Clp ATPase subunit